MNSELPLVSIVVPTFGRPKLLIRAINSILNQTYTNLEIIVVDDNNPNSPERKETQLLLEEYLEDPRIRYTQMAKNSGGAIARNKGVEVSNGCLVCFLDDDDEFLPNKLELQVKKFIESEDKLAVVGGFANILDENSKIKRVEKNQLKGSVFKNQLETNVCTTSIAMISKAIFLEAGGFSNVPSSQEHTLFIKIFAINPLYDYVEAPVVNIYHHDGARISTGTRKAEGAILLYEYVQSFYKQLTAEEIKRINSAHYINIIRAYMSIEKGRAEAFKYLSKLAHSKKYLDKEVFKYLLLVILGIKRIEKLKSYI
ncbi:glycosyltransferase family 2 protein [Priestia megaterium]|uniref:glycosyltransferase family 2 protein n=1 Tax=Priestia megaterium TaxID=1404 RepID=UPI002B253707|nr:glycosyltransferase family 2 protein [Priestia megaterium]MEB2289972.1 glycosyltransferase [Priestia megaterium]